MLENLHFKNHLPFIFTDLGVHACPIKHFKADRLKKK